MLGSAGAGPKSSRPSGAPRRGSLFVRDLVRTSVEVILANQGELGAYMASPNFRDYRFSWLRDGSFIAYAMLLAGRPDSAARFLRWVDVVIRRHEPKVKALAKLLGEGREPDRRQFLPARYTMEGLEDGTDWPAFQVDGYGTWLWCLAEYTRITGDGSLERDLRRSIDVTLQYLRLVWRRPCHDCWEENGDKVHPSSLACVAGGIRAINGLLARDDLDSLFGEIRQFILSNLTPDGRLPKFIGSTSIDASLLWVSTPFGVITAEDPVMQATVRAIEVRLLQKGGVKRYPEDTYFGGGQWLLLSSWLGWHHALTGNGNKARELLSWVEAHADAQGYLAEQDLAVTNDPSYIGEWRQRSGDVARPLLWSHAMYLVLRDACGKLTRQPRQSGAHRF